MGLLSMVQDDPEKLAALRQGLISAGAAMLQGGRQDFGTSLGQGLGAGVKTYAEKFDEARKKALAMAPYKAAMTPAKPAEPGRLNVGGQTFGLPQKSDAEAVSQNMFNLPTGANPYAPPPQDDGLSIPGMPASLMPQGMGIEDMGGGQVAPIEEVAAQPAQAASFDQTAFRNAILQDPTNPAYQKVVESLSKTDAPYSLSPGQVRYGADNRVIASAPDKNEGKTAEQKNFEYMQTLPEDQRQLFNKTKQGNTPSTVQEWQYYSALPPDEQARFIEMKRAAQIMNLGGTQAVRAPGGGIKESYAVTPKPDDMPAFRGAQAAAVETAKNSVEAGKNLPKTQASAATARTLVQGILDHPGFESSVGATLRPGFKHIPGTKESDFNSRVSQLQGAAFLEAFNTLKGGGQITEVEGNKATVAINRMSTTTSEKEFRAAAKDFLDVVDRAEQNARRATAQPSKGKPGVLSRSEILNVELQDAMARGDTQNVNAIRREMQVMKTKETSPKSKNVSQLPTKAPAGVDSKVWQHMTPAERKLWQ